MTIGVGDKIPSATMYKMTGEGPAAVSTDELFGGKTVAIFGVPGAFTPTCSAKHLPGFVEKASEIKAKGVDTIACVSVNDVFVMDAWGKANHAGDDVLMVADGNCEFTRAMGLVLDRSGFGMGDRSRRYALVAQDGVVEKLFLEEGNEYRVSSAEYVLANI